MKKIICLLISIVTILSLVSCEKETPVSKTEEKVRICALQGPTGMGLSKLFERGDYDISLFSSAELSTIVSKVVGGECDICAVPTNFASVLFNNTDGKIKIIGSATKGVLHILSNSNGVASISDLKGKDLYATGQGATPEYILNYVLQKNGIDPEKDINITYVPGHEELAVYLASNVYAVGMLPEPNVSVTLKKNDKTKIVLDMTSEFKKASGNELIQGVYIATKDFSEKYPEKIEQFLRDLNESVEFTNTKPEDAARLISNAGIIKDEETIKEAIPRCNIVSGGIESYDDIYACLEIFFSVNAKSVGGKVPDKNELFYYSK